jgi:ribosomal protein L7/L12
MGIIEIIIILAVLVIIFAVARNFRSSSGQAAFVEAFQIDWDAIADEELQSYLPHLKIAAIRRYRELTHTGLKEAKEAVEYALAHPDKGKKGKFDAGRVVDTDGAGVRDLIAEGRIDEAVDVYAAFMGVDEYTARDAIEQMQRDDAAEKRLSDEGMDEVRTLVEAGNKIEAIKRYRELTNLGLKEAKDEIDRMERDGD